MENRRTRMVVGINEKIRLGAHAFEFEITSDNCPSGEVRVRAIVYGLDAQQNVVGIKDVFESNIKTIQDRMDTWFGYFIKINTGI